MNLPLVKPQAKPHENASSTLTLGSGNRNNVIWIVIIGDLNVVKVTNHNANYDIVGMMNKVIITNYYIKHDDTGTNIGNIFVRGPTFPLANQK